MAIDDDTELRILRAALAEQEATIQTLEARLAEAEDRRAAVGRRVGGLSAVHDVVEAMDRERRREAEQWLQRELAAAGERAERTLDHLRRELAHAQSEREIITTSTLWRVMQPLRRAAQAIPAPLRGGLRRSVGLAAAAATGRLGRALRDGAAGPVRRQETAYQRWAREYDTLDERDRMAIRTEIVTLAAHPLISVVIPAYDTDEAYLRAAIGSVRAQLYENWELCIADDASPGAHVWPLLQGAAAQDSRIKIVRREENGHIAAATNSALALASGDFVALMDHDDLLPEHALYEVARELAAHPETDIIYSDEDGIDADGLRSEPYFKTDWNLDLLHGHNMVSHLGVYRRSLVVELGGMRVGYEGSQDYDLVLRAFERCGEARIRHIPAILYHWRKGQGSFSQSWMDRCVLNAKRAVAEHLERIGSGARVTGSPTVAQWLRVVHPVPQTAPLVSVIIPTKDRAALLERCVDGVLSRTNYAEVELLIVDNGSTEPAATALLDRLAGNKRIRVLHRPGVFNYPALNNEAVREAAGEIVLLLNNDVDVINGEWLTEMVSHAQRPEIGAVGAKLLYPDGRVQHAGVVVGMGGVAGHQYVGSRGDDPGYFGHLCLVRDVWAVTAACLAIRRETYLAVGGLDDQNLTVAFNDVDFCLRVAERGLRNLWTPYATLYHLESVSRGVDTDPVRHARFAREVAYMHQRWGHLLQRDPFFSPNFTLNSGQNELAFPPRRPRSWQTGAWSGGMREAAR